jgi:hypothetical protein
MLPGNIPLQVSRATDSHLATQSHLCDAVTDEKTPIATRWETPLPPHAHISRACSTGNQEIPAPSGTVAVFAHVLPKKHAGETLSDPKSCPGIAEFNAVPKLGYTLEMARPSSQILTMFLTHPDRYFRKSSGAVPLASGFAQVASDVQGPASSAPDQACPDLASTLRPR